MMIKSSLNALSSLTETALKRMFTFSLTTSSPLFDFVHTVANPLPPLRWGTIVSYDKARAHLAITNHSRMKKQK